MLGEIGVLYRGLILGVVIAAPVGPVGLLCIRRTLQKGMLNGLATGMGAALADAIFAAITVLGVSAVMDFIHHYAGTIRLVGGVIVLASAWHTWHDHPKPPHPLEIVNKVLNLTQEKIFMGSLRAFLSGFLITITNPLTLFGTFAVVATFGAITARIQADVLVAGIFIGSAAWWAFLAGGISLMRHHCTESRILIVNRVTAVILAALGCWALISGVHIYMR